MEKFREKIKADSETMERLNAVSKEYQKHGKELEFKDKIATAVYMAILDIDTKDEEEQSKKLEYMNSLNKVICNYEELKPVITEYLRKKSLLKVVDK